TTCITTIFGFVIRMESDEAGFLVEKRPSLRFTHPHARVARLAIDQLALRRRDARSVQEAVNRFFVSDDYLRFGLSVSTRSLRLPRVDFFVSKLFVSQQTNEALVGRSRPHEAAI